MAGASWGDWLKTSRKKLVLGFLVCLLLILGYLRYVSVGWTGFALSAGAALCYFLLSPDIGLPNVLAWLLETSDLGQSLGSGASGGRPLCPTCNTPACSRHRAEASLENFHPWIDLCVPQRVDSSLEEFLQLTFDQFIYTWYRKVSEDNEAPVDELKENFRFLVSVVLRRIKQVDLRAWILDKVLPTVINHLVFCVQANRRGTPGGYDQAFVLSQFGTSLHPALRSREQEVLYLRKCLGKIMNVAVPQHTLNSQTIGAVSEDVLSGLILLPLVDTVCDPDIVNYLLLIFLDDSPPPRNDRPLTPAVELLSDFSAPKTTESSCLHCPLSRVLKDQLILVKFLEFMRLRGAIHYLQFFLSLDEFHKRLIRFNHYSHTELTELRGGADGLYACYMAPDAVDKLSVEPGLSEELIRVARGSVEDVVELKNSDVITRAYTSTYETLENIFLPQFQKSDQFFSYWYSGKANDTLNRGQSWLIRENRHTVTKFHSKLKLGYSGDLHEDDKPLGGEVDLMAPRLPRPSRGNSLNDSMSETLHDLASWTVEIPSISVQFDEVTRKHVNYFTVRVVKAQQGDSQPASVYRRYVEFYNLEQRLKEFHGGSFEHLPPKKLFTHKDHEYLDSIKIRFEAYLKRLASSSQFCHSELLYTFLTAQEFSIGKLPEIKIDKFLKAAPLKLVKEKGQHLDSFMRRFERSTVAAKPVAETGEEKASELSMLEERVGHALYQNETDLHPQVTSNGRRLDNGSAGDLTDREVKDTSHSPRGVFELICYIADEVYEVPKHVHCLMAGARLVAKETVDGFLRSVLSQKLKQITEEHRLEHVIHLLRDAVFFDDDPPRTPECRLKRKEEALRELGAILPGVVKALVGEEIIGRGNREVLEVIQQPLLNKQVGYSLLDLLLIELFPEFSA